MYYVNHFMCINSQKALWDSIVTFIPVVHVGRGIRLFPSGCCWSNLPILRMLLWIAGSWLMCVRQWMNEACSLMLCRLVINPCILAFVKLNINLRNLQLWKRPVSVDLTILNGTSLEGLGNNCVLGIFTVCKEYGPVFEELEKDVEFRFVPLRPCCRVYKVLNISDHSHAYIWILISYTEHQALKILFWCVQLQGLRF